MIIKSLEQLNLLSAEIAKKLSKNDNIYLFGEIGAGKTTFTRYLINFLQIEEKIRPTDVLSPTFNLVYEYDFQKFKLMHYDLYRLKNNQEIEQLGIFDKNIVHYLQRRKELKYFMIVFISLTMFCNNIF